MAIWGSALAGSAEFILVGRGGRSRRGVTECVSNTHSLTLTDAASCPGVDTVTCHLVEVDFVPPRAVCPEPLLGGWVSATPAERRDKRKNRREKGGRGSYYYHHYYYYYYYFAWQIVFFKRDFTWGNGPWCGGQRPGFVQVTPASSDVAGEEKAGRFAAMSAVGPRAPAGRPVGAGQTPVSLRKAPLWAATAPAAPRRGTNRVTRQGRGVSCWCVRLCSGSQPLTTMIGPILPPSCQPPSLQRVRAGPSCSPGTSIWGHVWFATPEREGAAGIERLRSRLAA